MQSGQTQLDATHGKEIPETMQTATNARIWLAEQFSIMGPPFQEGIAAVSQFSEKVSR